MDRPAVKLTRLEHAVHRLLKPLRLQGATLLVACSGGRDSMLLAFLLQRLRPLHLYNIQLVYIDHGLGSPEQRRYRQDAESFVRTYARASGLTYHTNRTIPSRPLKSEEELRSFRYQALHSLQRKLAGQQREKTVVLCTAHHFADLLETRLLRLIRGTGPSGLKSMRVESQGLLRPILGVTEWELTEYAQQFEIDFIEDPSNQNVDAMRNWLRSEWLPQLEGRVPGSVRRLALSLELISSYLPRESDIGPSPILKGGKLDRRLLLKLSSEQAGFWLVRFFQMHQVRNYTQKHINEILKRLDSPRNEFRFYLLKYVWRVNAQHIWLSEK